GAHLWADRFDGLLEDVFELQDRVAISIAGVIEPTLRQSNIERARRKRPDSLDAYDLYLRAVPDALTAMPDDADKALALPSAPPAIHAPWRLCSRLEGAPDAPVT